MIDVALGIDIGGTNTKFGFVDKDGNDYGDHSVLTTHTPPGDIAAYLKYLRDEIEILRSKSKEELNIVGVGIGAPNGNYFTGTIEYAPNLSFRGVVPLVKLFKEFYNVPMAMTNDANAAAIGEMIYGGAKGMKDFILVTLGTGLGSGFVANGELVYGHDGFAGEMGHILHNVEEGRICGLGRKGCLESYVSATGIKRNIFRLLAEMTDESPLRDISYNQLSAETINELARKGDKIALAAFEETSRILGQKLSDMVAIFSPEAIFMLGGLAKAGDLLFKPTKKYMEEYMFQVFRNKVKILPSALEGKNAAILGASALIWKEIGGEDIEALAPEKDE